MSPSLHAMQSDGFLSGICVILSVFLAFAAILNIFPIRNQANRLLFVTIFSFTATEALVSWAYPLNYSIDTPTHHFWHFPFIHTFVLVVLTTSTGLHATISKSTYMAEKMYLFVITWIVLGLVWSIFFELFEELDGIFWSAIITSSLIAIFTRVAQILRHVNKANKQTSTTSTSTTVCGLCAVISVLSSVGLSLIGHHQVSLDLLVPMTTVVFLTTRRDLFIAGLHPAEVSMITSIVWWYGRVIYSIFLEGYGEENVPDNFQYDRNHSLSIWISYLPMWLIFANMFMSLLPIPAVLSSIFNWTKSNSQ